MCFAYYERASIAQLFMRVSIDAGTSFAIYGKKDTLILKKINVPDLKNQFEELVRYGSQHAKKLKIKQNIGIAYPNRSKLRGITAMQIDRVLTDAY